MDERSVALSATCNGVAINYHLALEILPLRSVDGHEVGSLSAFSYIADVPEAERSGRPVLFLTNGGPGSASLYLHLSGIGPLRAAIPTALNGGAHSPYGLEESPSAILDVADLVFVDAACTGFGSTAEGTDMTELYSMEGDARAITEAMIEWVRRHDRWNSPKYFLGESYGTQRAAFVASAVHDRVPMPLDGIALLGQAVNIQEVAERPGNVVGALANLPYKAATAWFHGVGSQEYDAVEGAVEAALEYAWSDLALAMLEGTAISPSRLTRVTDHLQGMIGVDADELARSRLWISKPVFRSKLLKSRGLTLGAQDSRYALRASDDAFGEAGLDPSDTQLMPSYAAAVHLLIDNVLGLPASAPYRVYDADAPKKWTWDDAGSAQFMRMGNASPFHTYAYPARLSRWMKQAPSARLFIGTGIYDSLTTIGAADHLVRQWDLPRQRVLSHWYRAGHMMYSDPNVATKLCSDLRAFVSLDRR